MRYFYAAVRMSRLERKNSMKIRFGRVKELETRCHSRFLKVKMASESIFRACLQASLFPTKNHVKFPKNIDNSPKGYFGILLLLSTVF
jgi:hypothetical protein